MEGVMIAVFARNQQEFNHTFKDSTPGLFKHIRNINDVRGRRFAGVVEMAIWYDTDESSFQKMDIAFANLKERQPELFKKQ